MNNLTFKYQDKEIILAGKTKLCGIVNITPDSFSDGGLAYKTEDAVERALALIDQGADMLDIGGESTRPGSLPISPEEEIERILPVIRELKKRTSIPLSIDTWKASVAQAALEEGADIINDITGLLGDKNMAKVLGQSKAGAILMFNPVLARPNHPGSKIFPDLSKEPAFSQSEIGDMANWEIEKIMVYYFNKSLDLAHKNKIDQTRLMLDPGIGFGMTKKENLQLIKNIRLIHHMGYPIFLGVSRKRFITNILDQAGLKLDSSPQDHRDQASAQISSLASFLGVDVLRVHTIRDHLMAREIGSAIRLADSMENINFPPYIK